MTNKEQEYYNESIGYLVGRASRIMAIRVNRNLLDAGFDASLDHWIILSKLKEEGGLQQQDLSFILGRDKTAITRLIDAMEEHGWVERKPDEEDRRIKRIYITEKGLEVRQDMAYVINKTNNEIEKDINPQDLEVCKSVLDQIFKNTWYGHWPCGDETHQEKAN